MAVMEHVLERGAPVDAVPTMTECCEALTRAVFEAGMSMNVIESKWDGFRRAFAGFDPRVIASFQESDVDALLSDTGIVRNRQKIEAAIANAAALAEIDRQAGGLAAWWRSHESQDRLVEAMRERFRRVGPSTGGRFLQLVGEVAPLDDRP